jgi:hypothetical protein
VAGLDGSELVARAVVRSLMARVEGLELVAEDGVLELEAASIVRERLAEPEYREFILGFRL